MSCRSIMLSQLHTRLGRRKEDDTEITPERLELWINKSTHIEQLHRCILFLGYNLEEPLTTLNLHFIFPLFSKCQIFTDLSSLLSVLKFGGKYVKNLQRCP